MISAVSLCGRSGLLWSILNPDWVSASAFPGPRTVSSTVMRGEPEQPPIGFQSTVSPGAVLLNVRVPAGSSPVVSTLHS